ncbi:MAG: cysteine hydrolase [Clostridia bacterium]|nr:cysteine hydrolase [Clostridia bacterium]
MILLVIDMQKALVDEELFNYETFVDSTVRLVEAARKNRVEVIFVQHDAGPGTGLTVGDEGFEIIDELRPEPGEKVFVKTINSCFGNKELKAYLKQQDDRRLMIIGLQTNYCIDATVKSAFERGFEVIVPQGMNSTFDNDYMTAETTVRYYNEDVWEELVDAVSLEEAVEMLGRCPEQR